MYLNNRIIAWDIVYQIMTRCGKPLVLTMLHPGGDQYECLAVMPYGCASLDKRLLINLNGNSIRAGSNSDLFSPYPELYYHNDEKLIYELAQSCGYELEDKAIHSKDSIRFLIDLLSQDNNDSIYISSAWYDGSYDYYLQECAAKFPYYEHKNEDKDAIPHIPWWIIVINDRAIAMCNIETDEFITITGMRYNLKKEKKEACLAMNTISQNFIYIPRGISGDFEDDLSQGMLNPILKEVHNDDSLSLEIRRKYINIYYRGGNLLRVREKGTKHAYDFEFDIRYVKDDSPAKESILKLPNKVNSIEDVKKWAIMFPIIKSEMNNYFATRTKFEREYEQLVVRENNLGRSSKATDYFICDIEYQVENTRFDLIAAKKSGKGKLQLTLIEMKYLDSALAGESGIIDHVRKANKYFCHNDLSIVKAEMKGVLETKRRLGILDNLPEKIEFNDEKPEFIFLLANHKPASSILETELNSLKKQDFYDAFSKVADLKIVLANYMGYGLYNDCVFTLEEFERVNNSILDIIKGRRK